MMPSEDTEILDFNQFQISDKASLIIYAYLECLKEKNDWCKNNLENLSTTKVGEHISTGFSMSTISSIKTIQNKRVYRGKRVIIKELPEECEGKFICLEDNTAKYIVFSVPTEKKVIIIDKKEKENTKTVSYKLQFIVSERFMANSSSNLVNNLAEEIHKTKYKYGHSEKNVKLVELNTKTATAFFEYKNFKVI